MRNVILTTALILVLAGFSFSQDNPHFEVGAHLTILNIHEAGNKLGMFGGRFAYHLRPGIMLEADASYNPGLGDGPRGESLYLFGIKAGKEFVIEKHSDRPEFSGIGIFAKVRPGFLHCGAGDCQRRFPDQKTFFATDIGVCAELYSKSGFLLRLDLGDTIINYDGVRENYIGRDLGITHNFAFSFGVGFRW